MYYSERKTDGYASVIPPLLCRFYSFVCSECDVWNVSGYIETCTLYMFANTSAENAMQIVQLMDIVCMNNQCCVHE